MRYLKLFEGFNSGDIDTICRKCGICDYTINEDGTIDVDGDVDLSYKVLTKLPLKFRNVTGFFSCGDNKLTSLEGCPQEVGDDFWCEGNYCDSNPCHTIYAEWINTDRRDELLDLMEDYDFLRGDEIYLERMEAFYSDAGLEIPNRDILEKYYTIIE